MGREDYNELKQNRIDNMNARAAKKAAASDSEYSAGKRLADQIPFGQPILVGHHSERRHRSDIDKIGRRYDAAIKLDREAKDLTARASAAESNRAISSDDPNAIEALREKLARLEAAQEQMKAVNKIIAAKPKNQATPGKIEQLLALGLTEQNAVKAFEPDCMGDIGFPRYSLSNNNARISTTKKRIEELDRASAIQYSRQEYDGFAVIIDPSLNRVQIDFDTKAVYQEFCDEHGLNMRRHGFVFSRRDGNCWQRKISNAAIYQANEIVKIITGKA